MLRRMNTETETVERPKTKAEMDQVRESYEWLKRDLSHHCDFVMEKFFDHGTTYAIAVEWCKGESKSRHAVAVESPGFSINQLIADNTFTRREVVRSFTAKRPQWR